MEAIKKVRLIKGVDNIIEFLRERINNNMSIVVTNGFASVCFCFDDIELRDDAIVFKSGQSVLHLDKDDSLKIDIDCYGSSRLSNNDGYVGNIYGTEGWFK